MSANEPTGNESTGQSEMTEKALSALSVMCAEHIQIVAIEEIDGLAKLSNNLYNEAYYSMRQQFFKIGTVLSYFELCKELKVSVSYAGLSSKTAQQIIKLMESDWQLFFIAQVSYQSNSRKIHQ